MRRTKDDAEATRQRLLDAAARVFARDGFAATRLEDIAAAAGVTRGAIAHHFGGKAEVFAALIAEKRQVIERTVAEAFNLGGTPAERLERFMVALLTRIEDDPVYRSMSELTLFHRTGYAAPQTPADRRFVYQNGIAKLLQAGIASGELRPDLDCDAAALAVLGLLCGAAVNWLVAPGDYSLKDKAPAIVRAFVLGLRGPVSPSATGTLS